MTRPLKIYTLDSDDIGHIRGVVDSLEDIQRYRPPINPALAEDIRRLKYVIFRADQQLLGEWNHEEQRLEELTHYVKTVVTKMVAGGEVT